MENPRILMLCNKPPYPARDGASVVMKVAIQSFLDCGCRLTVLCMDTPKHKLDRTQIPSRIQDRFEIESVAVDTDFGLFGLLKNLFFSRLPFHIERFTKPDFGETLVGILQSQQFEVVLLEGLFLCGYLPLIRQHSQAKVVLRAHNLEHEIWYRLAQSTRNPLKKLYLNHLAKRLERYEWDKLTSLFFDGISCLSTRDHDLMRAKGVKLPIEVAEMSIDISEIQTANTAPAEAYSVFFIGALDWLPNLEGLDWFFGSVWGLIRQKHPDVKCYVAGRSMPPDFLLNREKEGIIRMGEVSDARAFMQQKGVMIVPLLSGGGIRIKIIEGMAMAKAIVATTLALEGNPAHHLQEVCVADSPQDFATAVCALLENPKRAEALGQQAQGFAQERFNNRKMTERMLAFFGKL